MQQFSVKGGIDMNYPTGAGVKITDLKTITEAGKYALDARELNKSLNGTLANEVSHKLDMFSSAAAHNGIFRGTNLLTKYTLAQILTKISNGDFEDLYIGDYFDITISTEFSGNETIRCIIAGFDMYLNNGDTPLTRHHAVIVTKNCFAKAHWMNPINSTGKSTNEANTSNLKAYAGSDMHNIVLAKYADAILTVIGSSHLITHRTLLTNEISETGVSMAGAGFTGYSSGWAWYDTRLQLLSEIQVYGSNVWSSSGYDTGCDNLQLPLFALDPTAKVCKLGGTDDANSSNRYWWWLKNVASASYFAYVGGDGNSAYYGASGGSGVRPLFLIG